jgi:hypothetical protein
MLSGGSWSLFPPVLVSKDYVASHNLICINFIYAVFCYVKTVISERSFFFFFFFSLHSERCYWEAAMS